MATPLPPITVTEEPIVDDFKPVENIADDFKPVGAPEAGPSAVASAVRFPEALKDRIILGQKTQGFWGQLGADALEGFGSEPVGFSPEHEKELSDLGIFHQPGTTPSALRLANEAVLRPAAQIADAVFRGMNAGIYGAAGIIQRASQEMPGVRLVDRRDENGLGVGFDMVPSGENTERAGDEIKNLAQFMMADDGAKRLSVRP